MRIIIDTTSGLSLAHQAKDLTDLDAVVIGQGEIPPGIGQRDGTDLWLRLEALQALLGVSHNPVRCLENLIAAAQQRGDLRRTPAGDQLRIMISRNLP